MDRRIALWKETKEKLRNSNYTVSKTRLSVHNLPLDLEEQRLMQLFSTSTTDEGTKASRKLKQVKIVRDMNRLDKSGKPRSKRFGFVEFHKHEDALDALRALNNNPSIFGNSQRPIVSFALEDMRKLHVRQLKRKHAIENAKKPVKDSSKQEKGAKHKNNSHKRRKTQN